MVLALAGTGALVLFAEIPLFYAWVLAVSVLAFAVYGYDKGIADSPLTRAPEDTLILLAALGGTLGAMLGMLVFRHKVSAQKAAFRGRLFVVLALQALAGVAWVVFTQR
jgi:uncharacterized membrane protein YsdA (DUF1294 family)